MKVVGTGAYGIGAWFCYKNELRLKVKPAGDEDKPPDVANEPNDQSETNL